MQWFSFLKQVGGSSKSPSVRRKIFFPQLTENLKTGDWLYVSLADINVGRRYTYSAGVVSMSLDADSYLVVYETADTLQPTYSYIDSDEKLYFKSVTSADAGSKLAGTYYIYYHCNNVQYLQLIGPNYVQASESSGYSFIASEIGSGPQVIDKYSNIINADGSDLRLNSLSLINVNGIWNDQQSNSVGNKIMGSFDGPLLKIYGNKNKDCGKIKIKIIKTSSNYTGQSIVKETIVDLFNSSSISDTLIFSFDAYVDSSLTDFDDVHGSFIFEIEILDDKNISSSDRNVKITKYSYSKNYNLSIEKEEIYDNIVFISTGVVR